MSVLARNNVKVSGRPDGRAMIFAHGFGCDQQMWRLVAPAFEEDHRVVLFDHVGAGGSDLTAYDPERYGALDGYADDGVEICRELDLTDAVFVGHSVSAMIGVLAAARDPQRIGSLVLVGPSPRYIDADGYTGGFSREDIEELLESLDSNFLGWSSAMAPVIMGNPDPAGSGGGAHRQLLPHGSGDRGALRPRDVLVRQPVRPAHRPGAHARAAVQRRRDRAPAGGSWGSCNQSSSVPGTWTV